VEQFAPARLSGKPAQHGLAHDVVREGAEEFAEVHRRASGRRLPQPGQDQPHLLLAGGEVGADLLGGEEVGVSNNLALIQFKLE
jgi:hypothetical protein